MASPAAATAAAGAGAAAPPAQPIHYFLYRKIEHQRYWWDVGQWNTNMMPTDPKFLVTETVRLTLSPSGRTLQPPPNRPDLAGAVEFVAGRLNTEFVMTGNDVDAEGWKYAVDFSHFDSKWWSSSNRARAMDYARRRVRVAVHTLTSADSKPKPKPAAANASTNAKDDDDDEDIAMIHAKAAAVASPKSAAAVAAAAAAGAAVPAASAGAAAAAGAAGDNAQFMVNNVTPNLIFLALYESKEKGVWQRLGDVTEIKFGEAAQLNVAAATTKCVVSLDRNALQDLKSLDELKAMPQAMLGKGWFNTRAFYVLRDGSAASPRLRVVDKHEYALELDPWISRQQAARYSLAHNPSYHHWSETARVRVFTPQAVPDASLRLCAEERAYRAVRLPRAAAALTKFLDLKEPLAVEHTPVIGFAFSGGGCRALTAAIGWTDTMQRTGLYDAGMYCAGVSGGSWFTALWSASHNDWTTWVGHFRQNLSQKCYVQGPSALSWVGATVLRTAAFKPDYSFALPDAYGCMIAWEWFKNEHNETDRLDLTVSEQAKAFCDGARPLPIYNAVRPTVVTATGAIDDYEWLEFTPYECAAHDSAVAIPVWAFGREFRDGASVNFAPEQPLACLMGMFGSAFCASIEEMQRTVGVPGVVMDGLRATAPLLSKSRFVGMAKNYNFMAQQPSAASRNAQTIETVDAGVWVNCPIPAFYGRPERAVDVVFAFDARPTEEKDEEKAANDSKDVLRAFMAYCKQHGVKRPAIDLHGVGTRLLSVFRDAADPSVPVIAYIPLIKNAAYDAKVNPHTHFDFMSFQYSHADFDALKGLTAFNMQQILPELKALLKSIIERKRAAAPAAPAAAGAAIAVTVRDPNALAAATGLAAHAVMAGLKMDVLQPSAPAAAAAAGAAGGASAAAAATATK